MKVKSERANALHWDQRELLNISVPCIATVRIHRNKTSCESLVLDCYYTHKQQQDKGA